MLQCPNCHKIMEDGAKFCSECATLLVPMEEIQEEIPEEEAALDANDTEELKEDPDTIQQIEESAQPAGTKKHPRKGMFVSMLLAILAVVAMYVFYEDLGFDTSKKETGNAVLYVKDGELYYNDFGEKGETQITKNLSGAMSEKEKMSNVVRLSLDGKTVFYPDRMGAGTNGFSLYCIKPYKDELPIKLGNDVIWYDISEKGDIVYYITADQTLYRHDLNEKTKIAKDVLSVSLATDGKKAVYFTENALYSFIDNQSSKIASGVTQYCTDEEVKIVYYANKDGFYRYNFTDSRLIGTAKATVLSTKGVNVVMFDEEAYYVVTQIGKYELDCTQNTDKFLFSTTGNTFYYSEPIDTNGTLFDVYRVQIKEGVPQTAVLCESDVSVCITATDNAVVCLKDAKGNAGDLYIGGKCYGYDVNAMSIVKNASDEIAFLADCDESGMGTLTVFDGKKSEAVRADAIGCKYTEKGELVFLCDVGQTTKKGDLYRMVNGKEELVSDNVSILIS